MSGFHVAVGDSTSFTKTIGESDVYLFAGITGDLAPMHVNKAFMEKTVYKRLLAHGALLVGFMSTASALAASKQGFTSDEVAVSLGYDRVRFLAPVYFGDTVTVDYRISAIDPERRRATADIAIKNQDGTLVAIATHVLKWVKN